MQPKKILDGAIYLGQKGVLRQVNFISNGLVAYVVASSNENFTGNKARLEKFAEWAIREWHPPPIAAVVLAESIKLRRVGARSVIPDLKIPGHRIENPMNKDEIIAEDGPFRWAQIEKLERGFKIELMIDDRRREETKINPFGFVVERFLVERTLLPRIL